MYFFGTPVKLKFGPAGTPSLYQAFSAVPLLPSGIQGPVDSIVWEVDDPDVLDLVPDASDPKTAQATAKDVSQTRFTIVRVTVDADLDDGQERKLIGEWEVEVEPFETVSLHLQP